MSMSGTWGYSGTRCRIKEGWMDAGKIGDAFLFFEDNKKQLWIALQWDGEDDPDLHKAAGLEIRRLNETKWETAER